MNYAKRMGSLGKSDIREAMKVIAANPGTISFAAGSPDPKLFPAEEMRLATDAVLREDSASALQYGATIGFLGLRQQIVKMMKREGVDCSPEEICVTTGSQQAITVATMIYLDPEDIVITENPSYLGALAAFKPFQVNYVGVDGDEDGMIMSDLERVIKENPRAKAIYVIPNFQNPTGKTWSLDRRKDLLEIARKYKLPIFEDNAYGEVRFQGERIPSIKSLDRDGTVVYLGSFSKILSPGMRVGWICGDNELIQQAEKIKNGMDLQSAELAQRQIARYLEDNELDSHLAKINAEYKRRRDAMIESIEAEFPKEARYFYPKGGMFVWVELPEHINTRVLFEEAVEKGVAFVAGGSFYPAGDVESSMRLNYSMMTEDNIRKGIKILGQLLKEKI